MLEINGMSWLCKSKIKHGFSFSRYILLQLLIFDEFSAQFSQYPTQQKITSITCKPGNGFKKGNLLYSMCFISVEQSTDTQGVCFLFLPENIPFPTIIEYKNPLYVFPDSSGRGRERYLLIITVRRIKRKSLPYKSVIVIMHSSQDCTSSFTCGNQLCC